MGASVVVPGASAGIPPTLSVGVSTGGIFVAVAAIALFAYLDLFNASDRNDERLRTMLVAIVIPLSITFGAFVLSTSLAIV